MRRLVELEQHLQFHKHISFFCVCVHFVKENELYGYEKYRQLSQLLPGQLRLSSQPAYTSSSFVWNPDFEQRKRLQTITLSLVLFCPIRTKNQCCVHKPCKTPRLLPYCRMSFLQLALSSHRIWVYMMKSKNYKTHQSYGI